MAIYRLENYRAPLRDKDGKELPGEEKPEGRLISTCDTTRDAAGAPICEHWERQADGRMAYSEHTPSKGEVAALESREAAEGLVAKKKQLTDAIALLPAPYKGILTTMKELYEQR